MPARQAPYRDPPFPFGGATQADFEHGVANAAARPAIPHSLLHAAVRVCVTELKSRGMSPEGVLITMKAYLRHTAKTHFLLPDTDPRWALDKLVDQLSVWCIEEYYSPD